MKKLLVLLSLTAAAAAQDPGAEDPAPRLRVLTGGGIEAPTQPQRRSTSHWRTRGRAELRSAARKIGPIRSRVGSLMGVRGREENAITGYGLVIGLAGTGDKGELASQMLHNLLLTHNINVDPTTLKPKNLAVVHVEALLPAGMKPGQRIDARVSTIGDATSLVGGNLILTELFDPQGQRVYATVSGPITVGGFSVSGEAASATKNHTTVGTLPSGATVQREVPTRVVSENGFVYLDAKKNHATLGNLVRIAESINRLYPGVAATLPDGKTVRVAVPTDLPASQYIAYLDTILRQEIETDDLARVVINERTGTITMGGDVRLRPGVIAHGSIFVTIAETAEVSQPGSFSSGQTVTLPRTDLDVEEEDGALVLVPGAATLEEVVEVLNILGATPRDLISILTEMSESGMLVADIRRM